MEKTWGPGPLHVEASANVLDGRRLLWFAQEPASLAGGAAPAPADAEAMLHRMLAWRDRGNLYRAGGTSVVWCIESAVPRATFPLAGKSPSDWKRFWNDPQAELTEGRIRYQGGDLLAKLAATPEQLTPEDYRLRADSAGYRAGKDGKDLGADIDLVGPGKAYERWKATSEYHQWLKETGQLRAEAPKPELAAFTLLGGKGVAERKFDTLADAVLGASDGDTIEIRGNGPFVSDGVTTRHPLVIRAGTGYTPSIALSKTSADRNIPLVTALDALVLEGLELLRTGRGTGQVENRWHFVLHAPHRGSLHIANCRLIFNAEPLQGGPFSTNAKSFSVRNSVLAGNVDGTAWQYASGGRCNIENCVSAVGGIRFSNAERDITDVTIRVHGNTLVGNCLTLVMDGKPDLPEAGVAAPPIRLEFSSNVARWDVTTRNGGFLFFHDHLDNGPFTAPQAEAFLQRLIRLDEKQNVYRTGTPMLRLMAHWQYLEGKRGRDLADWNRFWSQKDTGSVEGDIRFQGGDLVTRARTAPERLTAEDFRLRPDSAGYRTGKDGKDLGADVDLVGPGPAYERWKKYPEYQQWLKDTGQVKK